MKWNLLKIEKINFIEFNTEKSSRGISINIPVIQIFDMEKNIFAEMKVKISDYYPIENVFWKT